MRILKMLPLGIVALLGCAGPQAPVPVSGDIAILAGDWQGEYSSAETGRVGSILFHLQAGTDSAKGDVLMVPYGAEAPRPTTDMRMPDPNTRAPRVLTIAFVRADNKSVVGQLDPYRDPDCGCLLTTTFTGKLKGNTFEGTFSSFHREMGNTTRGKWKVARKKPAT